MGDRRSVPKQQVDEITFMTTYPHSRLLLGPSRSLLTSGPHIQVLNNEKGEIIYSTLNLQDAEKDTVLKSGPIRCVAVDEAFTNIVTAGDDKRLKVWRIEGLQLLSERELPKKPTNIIFTRDGQAILVSDKFGDVFSYPLHPKARDADTNELGAGNSKCGVPAFHENPSDGDLILGHVSLLTCHLLTPDEQYIITADRDEHIRVSWYPKGCVIENYCLGHEKFVSALHIPTFSPSTLISGGGDPVLRLWSWLSGEPLAEISVLEAVESYIQVKPPRDRRTWEDGEGGERPVGTENNTTRRRRRGRKGKRKGRTDGSELEGTSGVDEAGAVGSRGSAGDGTPEADIDIATAPTEDSVAQANSDASEFERLVLVVHKILSLDLDQHGKLILFSAVGATALFYCRYPDAASPEPPEIHVVDVQFPVLDFTIGADMTTWVLLDPSSSPITYSATASSISEEGSLAVLISWTTGSPIKVSMNEAPPLLASLQTICAIPATPEELKTLDLYSALSSMPKNVDPEHDPLRRDLADEAEDTPEQLPDDSSKGKGVQKKEPTQREQARQRKKRALAAKLQEQKGKQDDQGDRVAAEDHEVKRLKSSSDVAHVIVSESAEEAMDES